jgi:AraC-like DNA-binding protein
MSVVADKLFEASRDDETNSTSESRLPLHYLATCLAQLLQTARRELDGDREAVKTSLDTASLILQSAIERQSSTNGSRRMPLTGWQRSHVCAFIEENLHRNIGLTDLSAIARRSRAHFSRSFKQAFGESPHAYVIRRRLERACHLMRTSPESLSEIALSVGFADQAHLARHFRRSFGQCPSVWRREHETHGPLPRNGMSNLSPMPASPGATNPPWRI